MSFNISAKEKLVEKNIDWEQVYTDKTLYLKEQFEDIIGPGSYFRFEGQDKQSGSEYYCIVGPAKIHAPIAKFFAGVRKLPATYSAGGKYFDSLTEAANYAKETWGVPVPRSLRPYKSRELHDIARKVDKWKAERENADESKEKEIEKEEAKLTNKEASMKDFIIIEADSKKKTLKQEKPQETVMDKMNRQLKEIDERKDPLGKRPRSAPKDLADRDALRGKARPAIPVGVQHGNFNNIMNSIFSEEMGVPDFEYDEDILKNILGLLKRQTGVGYQDIRTTLTHYDKRKPFTIFELLPYMDLSEKNPKIDGLEVKPYTDPAGVVHESWWLNGRRVHNQTKNTLLNIGSKAVELVNQGVLLDPDTGNVIEGKIPKTETMSNFEEEGQTSSQFGEEWGVSDEDIMKNMGIPNKSSSIERKKKVFTSVMKNLIKIAEEMDNKGNYKDAEEIHRVIRKYKEGI